MSDGNLRQKEMGEYQNKMREECERRSNDPDVAVNASHIELCNAALKHYEEISREAMYWSSLVPEAIKFYRDNYK